MYMKFIGNDSMGYVHGKIYVINISTITDDFTSYLVVRCKGHEPCPYSSLKALSKNWEDVVVHTRRII